MAIEEITLPDGRKRVFITAGTTEWPRPDDWNWDGNTVECVGGGGQGGVTTLYIGSGGGGGGYAIARDFTFKEASISVGLGTAPDWSTHTQFGGNGSASVTSTFCSAPRGGSGSATNITAGTGGQTANCFPTGFGGGNGGNGQYNATPPAAGGGGAGGPDGVGGNGATAAAGGAGGAAGGSATLWGDDYGIGAGGASGEDGAAYGAGGGGVEPNEPRRNGGPPLIVITYKPRIRPSASPNRVRILRSNTPDVRPTNRAYGEPYVNFADRQFGAVDDQGVPVDLIAAPYFSPDLSYDNGDLVAHDGAFYAAQSAVAPGTFDATQWEAFLDQETWDATTGVAGSFINKLLNGSMELSQRGGTFTPTNLAMTMDGWRIGVAGTSPTINHIVSPTGVGFYCRACMRITGAAGNTGVSLVQRIESLVAAPLSSVACTFQAKIQNTTGSALTVQLRTAYPAGIDVFGSVTQDTAAAANQPSWVIANGEVKVVACTFTAHTLASRGYQVTLSFAEAGSDGIRTGSIIIGEVDLRATPGARLGDNLNPPLPEIRAWTVERQLCYRYYNPGSTAFLWGGNLAYNAIIYSHAFFPTDMRATPTCTLTDGGSGAGFAAGAPTFRFADVRSMQVTKNSSGTVNGTHFQWSYTATAEL